MDADDEFIGKNALKTFSAAYQLKKAGVIYSNFYLFNRGAKIVKGFTKDYTESEKKSSSYRQAKHKFSQLRSYRTELFLKIDPKESLQDEEGKFFTMAYDMVMFFPLMELSCGRVHKIGGIHCLYNYNTGLNDDAVDRKKQKFIDNYVRKKPKLSCSK